MRNLLEYAYNKYQVDKEKVYKLSLQMHSSTYSKETATWQLAYFGEFLERHEEQGITLVELLCAALFSGKDYSNEQHFSKQLENFSDKAKAASSKDLVVWMLYRFFLNAIGNPKSFTQAAEEAFTIPSLNEDYLMLTYEVRSNHILLSNEMKKVVITKLSTAKFELDSEKIKKELSNEYDQSNRMIGALRLYMELKTLHSTYKITALKSTDSQKNSSYVNIKHLGTTRIHKFHLDQVKSNWFELEDRHFYLLNLLLVVGFYAEGKVKQATMAEFLTYIRKSVSYLDSDRDFFVQSPLGYNQEKLISTSDIKYNAIPEKYYQEVSEYISKNSTSINNVLNLFNEVKFLEVFIKTASRELDADNDKNWYVKSILKNFMLKSDQLALTKKCYDLFSNKVSFTVDESYQLIDKGVITEARWIETLEVAEKTNTFFLKTPIEEKPHLLVLYLEQNFDKLITLIHSFKNKSKWYDRNLEYSCLGLFSRLDQLRKDNAPYYQKNKPQINHLLNDYYFIISEEKYIDFLITGIEDQDFQVNVGTTKEALKAFLRKEIERDIELSRKKMYKRFIYTKEELEAEEIEEKYQALIENIISTGGNSINHCQKVCESLVALDNAKEIVEESVPKLNEYCNINTPSQGMVSVITLLRALRDAGLIDREVALNCITQFI